MEARRMDLLAGKVVLITGAGRGIGRAAALACARNGACVVANDLGCDDSGSGADPSIAASVAEEIRDLDGQAVASALDVTGTDAPAALVQLARDRFGRLDALFCSAGIVHERLLARSQDADFDRVFAVHTHAPMRLTRAASAVMHEQGEGGAILLSTAQAAFVGQREQTAICAASAAVIGFMRAAALELRRHQIRVNALAPLARTRTTASSPMFNAVRADSLAPEHVAHVVVHLLSPSAAEVSGECVGAAGGRIYLQRSHETTGAFLAEKTFDANDVARAWPQVTKT